jgi:hypothetical protein
MKRFTLVAALVLAGCVVSTPPPRTAGPPPGPPPTVEDRPHHEHERGSAVLTGVVLDARTHHPIDRAAVDITSPVLPGQRMTVQTGPDGRYTTQPVPAGEFSVRVRRGGYDELERQVRVGAEEARLDFALNPSR